MAATAPTREENSALARMIAAPARSMNPGTCAAKKWKLRASSMTTTSSAVTTVSMMLLWTLVAVDSRYYSVFMPKMTIVGIACG